MNDVDFPVRDVLAGSTPPRPRDWRRKDQLVVKRGPTRRSRRNGASLRGTGHIVRFIEYMDVGTSTVGAGRSVPSRDVLRLIGEQFPLSL